MPTLVSPERTIWRIPDKAALKDWCRGRQIKPKQVENLSQLLNFDKTGASGTRTGHGRNKHYVLHETSWLYHATVTLATMVITAATAAAMAAVKVVSVRPPATASRTGGGRALTSGTISTTS